MASTKGGQPYLPDKAEKRSWHDTVHEPPTKYLYSLQPAVITEVKAVSGNGYEGYDGSTNLFRAGALFIF